MRLISPDGGPDLQPPEVPLVIDPGSSAVLSCPQPALRLTVLRLRADFLRAASARRAPATSMLVQARRRADDDPATGIRVGFTCSKKVGNSVARNRAKRRLREAAHAVLPAHGRPGWDYVLVGRAEATAARPFPLLLSDLTEALVRLHADRAPR